VYDAAVGVRVHPDHLEPSLDVCLASQLPQTCTSCHGAGRKPRRGGGYGARRGGRLVNSDMEGRGHSVFHPAGDPHTEGRGRERRGRLSKRRGRRWVSTNKTESLYLRRMRHGHWEDTASSLGEFELSAVERFGEGSQASGVNCLGHSARATRKDR